MLNFSKESFNFQSIPLNKVSPSNIKLGFQRGKMRKWWKLLCLPWIKMVPAGMVVAGEGDIPGEEVEARVGSLVMGVWGTDKEKGGCETESKTWGRIGEAKMNRCGWDNISGPFYPFSISQDIISSWEKWKNSLKHFIRTSKAPHTRITPSHTTHQHD